MAITQEVVEIVTRGHADPGTEPTVKKFYNVYHFRKTVSGGTPVKANISAAFVTAIATPLQPLLSVSYLTDYIDVRFIDDYTDPYRTVALAKPGTVAGDSLPSVNNITLQLKTGLRGRTTRGSKHYGPIAEVDTTLDSVKATPLIGWNAFCATYLAGFTDADGFIWKPFLVSRKLSTFGPTIADVVGYNITEIKVNSVLGIMRRRKEK